MKKFTPLLALVAFPAFANLHLAPPDFASSVGRAVFVDFKTARYDITFDLENQVTTVKTKITFESTKTGLPIFDLVPKAMNARLDGESVRIVDIDFPAKASKAKVVGINVFPGTHTLELENEMTTNVSYGDGNSRVSSAFWIRDLKERLFLEQYVPSNLEYDQYQITMNVNFKGVRKINQEFYANGTVTQKSPVSWTIVYPDYYTVSCPYFHTTPKGAFRRMDYTYKSISGRVIPMVAYSNFLLKTSSFKNYSLEMMAELEKDYGPWPHPGNISYGTMPGTGGMEHSGATATSLAALDHEMLHSYFAKGVMPANGNSGWMDEAIASWRDYGYSRLADPGFTGSNIGGQSVYKRNTDDRSYELGRQFLGHIDFKLAHIGGLKAFLKGYFAAYKHTVVTQEHLKNNLEFWSGMDFSHEFDTYIWGQNPTGEKHSRSSRHHKPLTAAQLKSML